MKRNHLITSLLAAALAVSCIPAPAVVSSAADASGLAGDVNGDGTVSVNDASLLQQWLLAVPGAALQNPQSGDMNSDGKINARDLSLLKRRLISGVGNETADGSVITFSDGSVTVTDANGNRLTSHPAIKVEGQTVTITQPGEYTVSGSSSNGQLVVDVDKNASSEEKVTVNLSGLTLSNSSVAPIYVANAGDSCVISVKKDTVNTISDGTSHTDSYTTNEGETKQINAAIFARDDLKIKGKGTLIVNGNTADGIACTDDLKIYNGTITVKAADDGIRGKDSVRIGDPDDTDYSTLKLTVTSANGDGIKASNTSSADKGFIEINGGSVSVDAHADGMQASREVIINGGDIDIHTYQGKDYQSSGNPGGGNPGGGWPGGGWPGGGWGDEGHDLGLDFSCKGIKVGDSDAQIGGSITVNGGTLTVNSTDDALHCGDTLTVNGGTIKAASADDALHSDKYLYVKGGKITVTDSYEGIEAMQIYVKDGDLTIYAYDDALNAGEKGAAKTVHVGNDNCILQIDGGTIHAYVTNPAEGDTLDSNGKIVINGGMVYAEGSVNGPDSAMDSDGEMLVNGGTLVAIGGLGLGELPVDASRQCSLYWGNNSQTYQKGSVIKLLDASGRELLSYTAEQAFKCAIVSSADVQIGGRYTLTVNGNSVAEFNVSSALTKQGDVGGFGFGW